ncbi:Hemolysins and related proteins containing CBS domains [Rhizobium sp. 57MFTsu3.2]|nr:Hemolysins and related proteins containing CBS domains [Rhizobium sp. 57MFTsu3.2]
MTRGTESKFKSRRMRRRFFASLFQQLRILWPIFSGVLVVIVGSGALVGWIEGWQLGDTLYFTFVTGLTIGYGDLVPKQTIARVLALVIGLCGIVLTGLIAAASVQALRGADPDRSNSDNADQD